MLFTSFAFVFLFLPITLVGFFLLGERHRIAAASWLVLASVLFYGWWNPRYVILLVGSVSFNYLIGMVLARRVGKPNPRPRVAAVLAFGISVNLAVLAYYKYFGFFMATVCDVTGRVCAPASIILPLGISFFTFTQIAFLVDVGRGQAREYNPIHYFLFATYFPHLIAGPILHHRDLILQFERPETYRLQGGSFAAGALLFCLGAFKKIVFADGVAVFANATFDAAAIGVVPPWPYGWAGAIAYTLQLYFDFSGYSDMAVGLSLLFGVKIPFNFNSPYQARSIIDFWRRWHMTLSAFLRDYLYIPLGGNRHGSARRYLNLMITMLLGGLWHGAGWTFIAWGGLHGLYLVINHGWQWASRRGGLAAALEARWWWNILAWMMTLLAVILAWVLFRAANFQAAMLVFASMLGFVHAASAPPGDLFGVFDQQNSVVWIGVLSAVALFLPNSQQLVGRITGAIEASRATRLCLLGAACTLVTLLVVIAESGANHVQFIYFNF